MLRCQRQSLSKAHLALLVTTPPVADGTSEQNIFGQYVRKATIYTGSNVVELGDKGVLEPVDHHLGCEHEHHGLASQRESVATN